MEAVGYAPISPVMVVGPVMEIALPANAAKPAADPRSTDIDRAFVPESRAASARVSPVKRCFGAFASHDRESCIGLDRVARM
jgi:hypothetical protein